MLLFHLIGKMKLFYTASILQIYHAMLVPEHDQLNIVSNCGVTKE